MEYVLDVILNIAYIVGWLRVYALKTCVILRPNDRANYYLLKKQIKFQ